MDKKKTLYVIKATILSLKDDLHFYQEEEDYKGINYTLGRLDGLKQLVEVIETGRLDEKE